MKILSWNVNGIRSLKGRLKDTLDSLDADIICFQETKVTRDQLEDHIANVEGYNSYFTFSRTRGGYSGVATFCRDSCTPVKAEAGFCRSSEASAVGCYGELDTFTVEELQSFDDEGRAVMTEHVVRCADGKERHVVVINVYCPRADPERPERGSYKLRFYLALHSRTLALQRAGREVIVLGDLNTSPQEIDHSEPDKDPEFLESPARKWMNTFIVHTSREEEEETGQQEGGGQTSLIDTFRYLHPTQEGAYTCWSTLTSARATNYGHRIDYILSSAGFTRSSLKTAAVFQEVQGSDHCPVFARYDVALIPAQRCPDLCSRFLPEFGGRQRKLTEVFARVRRDDGACEGGQIVKEKRSLSYDINEGVKPKVKKSNSGPRQANLMSFFSKPQRKPSEPKEAALSEKPEKGDATLLASNHSSGVAVSGISSGDSLSCGNDTKKIANGIGKSDSLSSSQGCADTNESDAVQAVKSSIEWRQLLKGPEKPPLCPGHREPCVLRKVKKAGANLGKEFYVCCRPDGHKTNPEARCNFFVWKTKGKK